MKHPLLASRVLTAAGAIGGSARHCSRVCTAAAHVGHMDLVAGCDCKMLASMYYLSRWIATVDFNLACYHSLRVCGDTCASMPRLGTVEESVESLPLNAMGLHLILQSLAANMSMHCGKPNAQVTGNYDRTVPWFG